MSHGGARNRSGPRPDLSSERSEARKFVLTALPAEGYTQEPPEFPIPSDFDDPAHRDRELELWADAWRTPQACAWSMEPWRHRIVAQYCRLAAMVELDAEPGPGLIAQLHRFRDQIGLTPAGLVENGWSIASEPVKLAAVDKPVREQRRRSREMSA